MNNKMTNSQLSTTKTKKQNKLSQQLEQEQNQRNGHHMEGFQWGGRGRRMGKKVPGISSINGRYRIDRWRLIEYGKRRSQRTYMYDPWT